MKKLSALFILLNILFISISIAGTLSMTQNTYQTNENIITNFSGLSGNSDWLAIYPQGASNDFSNVIAWSYIFDSTQEFTSLPIGNYDARLFFNDSYTLEAQKTFNIINTSLIFSTDKDEYKISENIIINFEGLSGNNDWIAIYPQGASNDFSNIITWSYVSENLHTFQNLPIGNYEARLFFNNSYILEAQKKFTIVALPLVFNTNKNEYKTNEDIIVNFEGLSGNNDWIAIYPQGASNDFSNAIVWSYISENSHTFQNLPIGNYEARLFFNNSYTVEAQKKFTVSSMPIVLSTTKTNYENKETITINFSGLSGNHDWVAIYPANVSDDFSNVIAWAYISGDTYNFNGLETGDYEVKLFFNDSLLVEAKTAFTINQNSDIYDLQYKGLTFYHRNNLSSNYQLPQITDATLNSLSLKQQLQVSNKLLTTLFFGYPLNTLKEKLASGSFINELRNNLNIDSTNKAWIETLIVDNDKFQQSKYNEQEAVNILARFYAMPNLDHYYLNNWIAYILTQTIMFSPAYELESTHTPNIARVYNRLVVMLGEESGMRYMSYVHMMSEDNWRRFRSPEDNGREMLEIFTLDMDDSHVPIAAQALQNWKLDSDNDTLVVGLNQNQTPLSLFETTIYNGDDFYRELVKSNLFTFGVTQRLVSFFFPQSTTSKKLQITNAILESHPETWQDILLQIIFSEEYLLHSSRAKSAEELFYSTAKKTNFKHRRNTFHEFKDSLEDMHQASMKYKLGKLKRVPLDTLSFAYYHKYIRERMLLKKSDPRREEDYNSWSRQGWNESFISNENFNFDINNKEESLVSFINYLFQSLINRRATEAELTLFKTHMIIEEDNVKELRYTFDIFRIYRDEETQLRKREEFKRNITIIVLDYISRLTETYTLKGVQ